jgi:hypothetical protein
MRRVSLFRRRSAVTAGPPPAVARFWDWWAAAGDQVAAAVDRGDTAAADALVAPHVRTLDPALRAETGGGRFARRRLVVTAAGRTDLRPLTERWCRASPGDGLEWEFLPARPAVPEFFDRTIDVGGVPVQLGATAVEARTDDRRCRLDIGVWNPALPALTEEERERFGLCVLEWALGEDDVERWVGQMEPLDARPLDSVPASMLAAVTEQLTQRWGGDGWALLEGTAGTRRLVAQVRRPLHRVDHALFDEHVAVSLPYTDLTLEGLPGETAAGDLRAFEEALVARVGGRAVLVAHETTSGERLLHLYDDALASVLPDVRSILGGYIGGGATATARYDPAWRSVEHLRL